MNCSKRESATATHNSATHNSVNEATNRPSERSLTQEGSYCNLWLTNGYLGDCEGQRFTGHGGCFWGDLMFWIWIGIGLHRYLHLRISEMVHWIYMHRTVSKLYLRSKRSGPVVNLLHMVEHRGTHGGIKVNRLQVRRGRDGVNVNKVDTANVSSRCTDAHIKILSTFLYNQSFL